MPSKYKLSETGNRRAASEYPSDTPPPAPTPLPVNPPATGNSRIYTTFSLVVLAFVIFIFANGSIKNYYNILFTAK